MSKGPPRDFTWWQTTFSAAVRDIGHTAVVLAPWRAPLPLTRIWCLFELEASLSAGVPLELLLGPREERAFSSELARGGALRRVVDALGRIDVASAEATVEADRVAILEAVERSLGCHEARAGGRLRHLSLILSGAS